MSIEKESNKVQDRMHDLKEEHKAEQDHVRDFLETVGVQISTKKYWKIAEFAPAT